MLDLTYNGRIVRRWYPLVDDVIPANILVERMALDVLGVGFPCS